jgi:preprotein translocase subunit Sss1
MDTTRILTEVTGVPDLGERAIILAIGLVALGILAFLIYAKMDQSDRN